MGVVMARGPGRLWQPCPSPSVPVNAGCPEPHRRLSKPLPSTAGRGIPAQQRICFITQLLGGSAVQQARGGLAVWWLWLTQPRTRAPSTWYRSCQVLLLPSSVTVEGVGLWWHGLDGEKKGNFMILSE